MRDIKRIQWKRVAHTIQIRLYQRSPIMLSEIDGRFRASGGDIRLQHEIVELSLCESTWSNVVLHYSTNELKI